MNNLTSFKVESFYCQFQKILFFGFLSLIISFLVITSLFFISDFPPYQAFAGISDERSNIELTKIVNPVTASELKGGDTFNYTVTITNLGPDTAENITVIDLLSSKLSFVSSHPNSDSVTPPFCSFNAAEHSVTCNLGNIPANEELQIEITSTVDEGVGGNLRNVVRANTITLDPIPEGADFVFKWGESGSGNNQFKQPVDIELHPITDDIYVVDQNNNRIQVFDSAGNHLLTFGSFCDIDDGTGNPSPECDTSAGGAVEVGDGQFNNPRGGIAIYPVTNNVFIADFLNNRIQVFDSAGIFLFKWGESGIGDGQFKGPRGIAIHPVTNNVYVADFQNNRIQVFDSAGVFLFKWEIGRAHV